MVQILDVRFHDGSLQDAIDVVVEGCIDVGRPENRCISATGAHGVVEAKGNHTFADILNSFSCNLPDGMPVVWLGRLKGARHMERCYGPDFFRDVIVASAEKPVGHFFCGGKEGIADELRRVAETRFGNRNIVGTFCPPFREMTESEWKDLAARISTARADIVWIGLSTPKQERFALELSRRVNVHFIITIGAAFDIHTAHLRQAPRIIQRMGLEWLFRLIMEPRRLWRRYLKVVPLFLVYAVIDLLGSRRSTEPRSVSTGR